MADQKKKAKLPSFTSPKGTFKFPKLSEPDYGNKDYPKPDGEYSVKLILVESDPATQAFIEKMQPLYDEALAAAEAEFADLKAETRKKLTAVKPNDLFTRLLDQETEEPTGEVEFKFGMKAGGTIKQGPREGQKWERAPAIFDAKGQPIKGGPPIWGGTVGKVAFVAAPYFIKGTGAAGLKLGLDAVQVIDLVSAGMKSAEGYGFGEEEGYEYEAPAKTAFDEGDESGSGEAGETAGSDAEADF